MATLDARIADPSAYLEAFARGDAFGSLLGHRVVSLAAEGCTSEYTPRPEHMNPNGILHGGALFAAMDSAQGALMHFVLEDDYAFAATGTATIKYHRPVRTETLRIATRVAGSERRKRFVRSEAFLPDGALVAELDEVWIAVPR